MRAFRLNMSNQRPNAPFWVVVLDFCEGIVVDILFLMSLSALALTVGCRTLAPAHETKEISAAADAVARAEKSGLGKTLPTTVERAQTALAEARELTRLADTSKVTRGERQALREAAASKASQASTLVEQASMLQQRLLAWDQRIEGYYDEQLSQQLLEMLASQFALGLGDDQASVDSDALTREPDGFEDPTTPSDEYFEPGAAGERAGSELLPGERDRPDPGALLMPDDTCPTQAIEPI